MQANISVAMVSNIIMVVFCLGFKSNLKKINKKIFLFELFSLGLLYRIKQTI